MNIDPISSPPELNNMTDMSQPPFVMTQTTPDDPAYLLLMSKHESVPVEGAYRSDCYICRDPEFAQLGMSLCQGCPRCTEAWKSQNPELAEKQPTREAGHVPADDEECSECGYNLRLHYTDPEYVKENLV